MKQFVVFLAVSFFSLVFCVSSLSAAERDGSAVHTTLRGVQNLWTLIDEPMAQRTRKVGSSRVEEISPIRFTTRIRQLGSMHVELNQRMNVRGKSTRSEGNTFVEDSSVWLLRGEYTLRHHRKGSSDRQKIAATIYQKKDGDYGVLLSFRDNTRKRHRRIQYDLKGSFSRDSSEVQARISRFPSSLFQTRSCATEDSFAPNGMEDLAVSASMSASAATLKEVDVFAIADSSFSTVTGGEATANMLATINAASVFYESQLGLTFNVIGSHVFTSGTDPYSGVTAAGDFLTEITNDQPPHVTFGE
ncbi:MAG: hypothetical protein KDD60_08085, partial [Bdellovibrionales bacterium]|nr:hypothetical protein [Bdellovibrionales bacterium]